MIGLVDGLRAGASDARAAAAEERAWQEQQARKAYQDQLLAMQQAQERRAQMEFDARQRRQSEEDSAVAGLADLHRRDQEYNTSIREGGIGPIRPVTDREYNTAQMGLATARRDVSGMTSLRQQGRMLDVADEATRLSQMPDFQSKAAGYISDHMGVPFKIELGKRDPKTGKQIEADRLVPDEGKPIVLKDGDMQRVAYGVALSKFGLPGEGSKVFREVSQDLSGAIDRANQRMLTGYNFQSQAQDRLDRAADRDADREVRREQIQAARAARGAAATQQRAAAWQQERLERGDKLGREAAGYAQGLSTARSLGSEGRQAAAIYEAQLAGAQQHMAGLGLKPFGLREPVPAQVIAKATEDFMQTPQGQSMTYPAAYALVAASMNGRGTDPMAEAETRFLENLKARAAADGARPSARGAPAAPGPRSWSRDALSSQADQDPDVRKLRAHVAALPPHDAVSRIQAERQIAEILFKRYGVR